MRIRKREQVDPICIAPGDSIILTYTDEKGDKRELLRETLDRTIMVDECVVFDCAEEFGWEDGIGGAFGKRKPTE